MPLFGHATGPSLLDAWQRVFEATAVPSVCSVGELPSARGARRAHVRAGMEMTSFFAAAGAGRQTSTSTASAGRGSTNRRAGASSFGSQRVEVHPGVFQLVPDQSGDGGGDQTEAAGADDAGKQDGTGGDNPQGAKETTEAAEETTGATGAKATGDAGGDMGRLSSLRNKGYVSGILNSVLVLLRAPIWNPDSRF